MGNIVDSNGKPVSGEKEVKAPEQIVEKIPDKLLKPILDAQNEAVTLQRRFNGLALRLAQFQKDQLATLEKMENQQKSIQNKIQRSYDKMKLSKRKNIKWSINLQKGEFLGSIIPDKNSLNNNEKK